MQGRKELLAERPDRSRCEPFQSRNGVVLAKLKGKRNVRLSFEAVAFLGELVGRLQRDGISIYVALIAVIGWQYNTCTRECVVSVGKMVLLPKLLRYECATHTHCCYPVIKEQDKSHPKRA